MLEKKLEIEFEYFPNTGSFSIHKDSVVLENGVEFARNRDSRAFVPGQVDELAEYLGDPNHPLISYCNIIWTPDIIEAQKALELLNRI